METWIPLALLAPLLYTGSNFIDKYLIEKITENSPATVITILAGLAGLPFLIVVGFASSSAIADYGFINALGATVSGLILIYSFYFYYKALLIADASIVAALFQLIVVFNYIFGLIFLNEHLSLLQLSAMAMVIAGSVLLTLESHEKKLKLNKKVFLLMLFSCFLIGISDVIFKSIAKDSAFWPTQFYEYSAGVIAGAFLLLFYSRARQGFFIMMKKFKSLAIGASGLNEVFNLGGLISMRYAMFLAPIAVVQAVMSVQSVYLLIIGVLLTILFPKYIKENITKKHIAQKAIAILIMIIGTAILALNS